ncbi:MAG: LCP family protein [Tissierellia bacterium]|jgi:LCP family protein required for cell wall assembly|nr:LCP family protein [Bacillota bacterium]NLK58199.1 LCP family protein [Tissierellia bacterium]
MRKAGLITFFVSLLLFTGIFAASNQMLPKVPPKQEEEVILDRDLGEDNVIEPTVEGELLFLVVGVDKAEEQYWARTDTLILVHANLGTGDIHLISIPRDTRVFIDEEHGNDKINHAHAFGGMTLTMRTIRQFLGIDLDYYVLFNYDAVKHIVDAIGGIEIDVPMDVFSGSHYILVEEGFQRLDGEKALHLAQFRAGYEDGDIGRLNMQQKLIVQTIKELLSARNIPRLPQLLDVYYEEVQTNLSLSKLAELIPIAGRFSADNVSRTYVPGGDSVINNIYYYEYDRTETQRIIDTYLADYKIENVYELDPAYDLFNDPDYEYEFTDDYYEEEYYEEDTEYTEYYEEPVYEEEYEEPVYEEEYEEEYDEDDASYEDTEWEE